MGESPFGNQTQLSVACGALRDSPLYLGHHSRSQRSENVDSASAPVPGVLIERAERAKHVTVFCCERDAGVSSGLGPALGKSGFIPGIRDHDRHSGAHHILTERSFERVPAG